MNPYTPPAIDELLDDSFTERIDQAVTMLAQLIRALGPGRHTITCVSTQPEHDLRVRMDLLTDQQGTRYVRNQLPALTIAFALAFLPGRSIGIVSRSYHHEGDLDVVRGWAITDGWPDPLTAEQVHRAYTTDHLTGDPLPADPDTLYAAGIAIPAPDPDRAEEGGGDDTAFHVE